MDEDGERREQNKSSIPLPTDGTCQNVIISSFPRTSTTIVIDGNNSWMMYGPHNSYNKTEECSRPLSAMASMVLPPCPTTVWTSTHQSRVWTDFRVQTENG